jgi:nitroreductase
MSANPIAPAQLLAALHWRYATKAFDPVRRIPDDVWAVLEQSLVLAPSSFGLQPYRFLVIHDPAVRQSLLPQAWGQKQVVEASHFVVFAARTGVTEAEIDRFLALAAETRGVSTGSLAGYRGMMTGMLLNPAFQPVVPHWTARQAYIALGGLMTGAALLGIDACPIEGFVPAEFDRILGLPAQGLTAVACCALGYRHASDKHAALPKVRFPASTLVQPI